MLCSPPAVPPTAAVSTAAVAVAVSSTAAAPVVVSASAAVSTTTAIAVSAAALPPTAIGTSAVGPPVVSPAAAVVAVVSVPVAVASAAAALLHLLVFLVGHQEGAAAATSPATVGPRRSVLAVLLDHLLVLVPDQLPSHVLFPCIVGGDPLVGIAGAHEVAGDLADRLVGGGVGPHEIKFHMLDAYRFLQRAELGDDGGDLAEEFLLFQGELSEFLDDRGAISRSSRIVDRIVFVA
mmetsp:Transcript_23257/g.49517  ORF Transcript_23257/g.49517 Transcript_23257/m.49517 type:complete len:236 (+) Transcript_23257:325-1032(+)